LQVGTEKLSDDRFYPENSRQEIVTTINNILGFFAQHEGLIESIHVKLSTIRDALVTASQWQPEPVAPPKGFLTTTSPMPGSNAPESKL
jgi:hypothetical protein